MVFPHPGVSNSHNLSFYNSQAEKRQSSRFWVLLKYGQSHECCKDRQKYTDREAKETCFCQTEASGSDSLGSGSARVSAHLHSFGEFTPRISGPQALEPLIQCTFSKERQTPGLAWTVCLAFWASVCDNHTSTLRVHTHTHTKPHFVYHTLSCRLTRVFLAADTRLQMAGRPESLAWLLLGGQEGFLWLPG